jgi:hypothetical protein
MSTFIPDTGRGSALEDTRRQRSVVVGLCLVGVALVVVAVLADTYLPLFFVWVPQLAIPVYLSRSSRRRASPTRPGSGDPLRAETSEPSPANPRSGPQRSDRSRPDRQPRPPSDPSPPSR